MSVFDDPDGPGFVGAPGLRPPGGESPLPGLLAASSAERWRRVGEDPELRYLDVVAGLLEEARQALGSDGAESRELASLAQALFTRLPEEMADALRNDFGAELALLEVEWALGRPERAALQLAKARLLLDHGSGDPLLEYRFVEAKLLAQSCQGASWPGVGEALRLVALALEIEEFERVAQGWLWVRHLAEELASPRLAEAAWLEALEQASEEFCQSCRERLAARRPGSPPCAR